MDNEKKISEIREEYREDGIVKSDLFDDPIDQFNQWMKEALDAGIEQPNAMTLATSTREGRPSARIVLLKEVTNQGFIFFTNYSSQKSRELEANPYAALVFLWLPVSRQIRVEGSVQRVSGDLSDEYFSTRPRGSQIGAWASNQSSFAESRDAIEASFSKLEDTYRGEEIPRPPNWGGYVLQPERIEFWQGRPSRLHDRILYRKDDTGEWEKVRLFP